MDVNYSIEGNGYVYEQSVNAGDDIGNDEIIVKLKEKWWWYLLWKMILILYLKYYIQYLLFLFVLFLVYMLLNV